jgi:hypothetical protein
MRGLLSMLRSPRLLYYAIAPSAVALAGGLFLLSSQGDLATVGSLVLAVPPLAVGVGLVANVGDRASVAAALYKREPANPLVRNLPAGVVRWVWGGGLAAAGFLLLLAAIQTM